MAGAVDYLTAAENEFVAEDDLITIVPNVRMEPLDLICVCPKLLLDSSVHHRNVAPVSGCHVQKAFAAEKIAHSRPGCTHMTAII